jgi:hypothetical protein
MFDDVVFLHDGEVTYHGPVKQLPPHFDTLGFPCKANFNPADHVMFTLQKEPAKELERIKAEWARSNLNAEVVAAVDKVRQKATESSSSTSGLRSLGSVSSVGVGFCRSLIMLTRRETRGTLRNKGSLGARFGMSIFLALLYAWLFAGSGKNGNTTCGVKTAFDAGHCSADFQAHYGTLVSLAISAMMGSAQPVLLTFPNERPVFLREYAGKQYGVVPYFISKTFVELFVVLISQVLTFVVAYPIMGLHGNFALLVIYGWVLGIASSSLALVIGCGVAAATKAIQLAPLALIPQMLFSGLFLPVSKIPESLRWVKFICPLKYAISLLTDVEFQYVKDAISDCDSKYSTDCCKVCSNPSPVQQCEIPGQCLQAQLIRAQSVDWDDWLTDLGALIALLIAFRVISTILLWRKGKYVY